MLESGLIPHKFMLNENMPDNKPLVLVDGSSYLFRAYHALPKLSTAQGFPTGALKGVVSMLRKLVASYPGSPVAVVFDARGKTFRHERYPDYKANRPPMPDDLAPQIEPLHAIVKAMGLPLLVVTGVEADDVIGTLTQQASAQQQPVVVSTSDKDLAQLVNEQVTLVDTMTDKTLDVAGVQEKFLVAPSQIVDLLALTGDTSDNIPGIPKVGPTTAAKWLNQYQNLDALIAHADEIKGKVGENLRAHLAQLPLARELASIKTDVALPLQLADLQPPTPDLDALVQLYRTYEFQAWLNELAPESAAASPAAQASYEVIDSKAALADWLAQIRAAGLVALDTETTSLNYMQARLVGVSLAVQAHQAAYIPLGHDYPGAPDQLPLDWVLKQLQPVLEDPAIHKIGQNIKYDQNVLANHGINLAGVRYDTMLESYVLDSVASRHNMDDLARRHLQRDTIRFEDVAGKGAKQLSFNQVPLEQAAPYAAEDADVTWQLHQVLWPKLRAEPQLLALYEELEMPLVAVLSRMERAGALVDGKLLAAQSKQLSSRMRELTEQAWQLAGDQFNLDSTQQLQKILYEKMGLPIIKKTPGGAPSTAEPVLAELAHDYELPRVILEYRSLAKLKSTYTDKLPLQINASTGRIHTSYHQAVTATGRLSSSDPNLQNIPIRTPAGRQIRQAFIAPKGKLLLAADYSQIELRIMAHLSGDAGLRQAFADNLDVHKATAAEVFDCPLAEVTPEQRRSAKAINFGLIYGMSAFGLGRQLGLSRQVAQQYIDRYFARYPGVLAYMEATKAQARSQGYVETLFGRRLYLPDINAKNPQLRQGAERTAINAPMQGTAADIIKRAMLALDAWLRAGSLDAQMILQVHDELIFEVAQGQQDALAAQVRSLMTGAANLDVPLLVDVGTGANWDEAH